MYAILRPTDVEHDQPYVSTLMSFKDRTVLTLDDITKNIVTLEFHVELSSSGGTDHSSMEKSDEKKSLIEPWTTRRLVIMNIRDRWLVNVRIKC